MHRSMITENIYKCEMCNYNTPYKNQYNIHMNCAKHKKNVEYKQRKLSGTQCNKCLREYSSKSSLSRHIQKCKKVDESHVDESRVDESRVDESHEDESHEDESRVDESRVDESQVDVKPKIIMNMMKLQTELISQNANMHNLIITVIDKMGTTSNSNNTVASNNNNKTFNMNFFLNEHCKNAIDIGEFIQKLDYSKENMLENRSMNYYERISNQFKEGFENCKVENRPIHCSDSKRNKMYIKDNGEWISGKDSEKRMKEIVFDMGRANMDTFRNWVIDNPSCLSLDTPCYELYMCILRNILGPTSDKEEEKFVNKVISSLAEETMIDKEKYAM